VGRPDAGEAGGADFDHGEEAVAAQGAILLRVGSAPDELLDWPSFGEQRLRSGIRGQSAVSRCGWSGASLLVGGRCGGDRRAKKVQGTFPSRRRRGIQE
jgi:hypothetical protein